MGASHDAEGFSPRGDRLAGRLDLPDGKPRAAVLVAHCFSGGNAGPAAAQIARSFNELSMAVLSLDFARARHAGEKPASATVNLGVDDLAIAADQLRSTMFAPSILVGHSLGGAAVLAIAARVPEARAVVTLGTPVDAAQVADLGRISVPGQRQRVATLRRPLLVIHSPDDEAVGIGLTPYDLLLAGLGACTAITVRMYAERKGWRLRHTTVRLRHRHIHATDCAGCETRTGQLDHIEREIQFEGELTDQQRARLLDIAERCPVHRTLHSEVLVSTSQSAPDEPGASRLVRRCPPYGGETPP